MGGLALNTFLLRNPDLKLAGVIFSAPFFGFADSLGVTWFKQILLQLVNPLLEVSLISVHYLNWRIFSYKVRSKSIASRVTMHTCVLFSLRKNRFLSLTRELHLAFKERLKTYRSMPLALALTTYWWWVNTTRLLITEWAPNGMKTHRRHLNIKKEFCFQKWLINCTTTIKKTKLSLAFCSS